MKTTPMSQRVPLTEKIGYSLGDGAANLAFQMMMMFQLFFYTDVFGIKATAAGTILLIARVVDAFVDPVVGILADRSNSKWGKYRPWVLWTAIPFAIFFILAFTTPDMGERAKIIYAGITYTLLMSIYSFNNTPYASLGGVMTSDIGERTSISTVRFVTATVATFIVQGLTLPLVSKFGNGEANDPKGWFWTITLFAVVSVGLFVATFFSSKERITPPKGQKNNFKQDFKDLIGSLPWRSMFILTLFLFITLALFGSAMSYYFNYFVDKEALQAFLLKAGLVTEGASTAWQRFLNAFGLISKPDLSNVFAVGFSFFNMIGQLVTLAGVLLLSQPLARLYGKRNVFVVCLALTALFTGLFFVVNPDQVGWIFIINILKNAAYAPTIPLLWAMMGDVADYTEWKHNRRATGFCFAGIVFALKAGLGFGGAICGAIIASFGFVANTIQTEQSLLGIRLTASLIPAATFAICVICLLFYPISKKLNITMQAELAERRESAR
ncbi:MAG: MFS transporter [Bacteroidales bacterium]|jgi:Na+/melibiose symporter-like transporter|nr:MFS transporter [Bacteroidales bacterium]HBL73204.1 MFS transporter [Bacteroidales bacterium]